MKQKLYYTVDIVRATPMSEKQFSKGPVFTDREGFCLKRKGRLGRHWMPAKDFHSLYKEVE
uniref:Uncharacterized protein n=1 Tax=viral metagenome TaxID=1070528 RepID=A0A6M3L6V6_9ZZZZ